jgi:glucan phosphoethanolaminetransferase (alkaline phosphatase superfamily)
VGKNKHKYPNIILIVIDALRARNLGCYGEERNPSPNIDKIADKGVLFEDVYCSWNTTDQSLTTILSGRYPRTHGIIHHGESLTEHDIFFDHHGLYDVTTHAPLIFYYPKAFSKSKRLKGLIGKCRFI